MSLASLAFIVILFTLVIIFDFRPLLKQKLWKDCVVYAAISLVSFSVLMLDEFGVNIKSPFQLIIEMFLGE